MMVQTLPTKNDAFFVKKKLNKKLPNSIITFFLIMQFVFGFNFGFVDALNEKIRSFLKLISLLISLYTSIMLLMCILIFMSEWDIIIFSGILVFIHYCGHTILLNFSKYKVYNFITTIRDIDDAIKHSNEHTIGLLACISFGCWFAIVTIGIIIMCVITNLRCIMENKLVVILHLMPFIGLDGMVLVQLIANFYTYYAVIYLVGLVGREKTSFIRKQFLRVSECCEKFGGHYGNLVVLELLVHTIKCLALICSVLNKYKENVNWRVCLLQSSYSFYVIFQMCAPAIIVERVIKQMENLRSKLYTQLMEENDLEKHLELSSLLRCMEQKPLYNKAWRVIPTDVSLVVALFSFITTYIIVILQFMHIY